jgi:8-oxo-dGTP pyrophosphatase MutT (NUDIX family)
MEISHVVTAFLRYKDKILILRRSDSVGTYKGRWGGISGYIEEDESPLDRAVIEVRQETGIKKNEIMLIKEGRPFVVKDEFINKKWIVHPFLFRVRTDKIKLDKEHKETKWIKPEELTEYDTVPELEKSLKRVL